MKIFMILILIAGGIYAGETKTEGTTNAPPKIAAKTVRLRCQVCNGKGSLKVSPPDRGQFGGGIERKSRWDVKLDQCPICKSGRGWIHAYDLSQIEPSTEEPCSICGWSGLVKCRMCLASGTVKCKHRGCEYGWIITKADRTGRSSARKPPKVELCPECKGTSLIVCPSCRGKRAELCRKCHGTGRKMK